MRSVLENAGISFQPEPQVQPQPEGASRVHQQPAGSPRQQGPVYQEMSTMTPQQWALQALDKSTLQASWLSEVEPGEEAELGPRWVLLEQDWWGWCTVLGPGPHNELSISCAVSSLSSPLLSMCPSLLPGPKFGKSQLGQGAWGGW